MVLDIRKHCENQLLFCKRKLLLINIDCKKIFVVYLKHSRIL